MRKLLIGSAALALLAIPTVGLAGKPVKSGDQSLQIFGSLKPAAPAKPGKVGATFAMRVVYKSLNEDSQVKERTKAITLTLPKGMKVRTDKAPACLVSVLIEDATKCPEGSMIGQGTGTADARPTLPAPVDAELFLYNSMDDTYPDNSPRDPAVPALTLYAKTSIGYNTALPFDIVSPGVLRLDYPEPKEDDPPQLFHIENAKFVVKANGAESFFTRPGKCPKSGSWPLMMTIDNFDGPSVTAKHKMPCSKA